MRRLIIIGFTKIKVPSGPSGPKVNLFSRFRVLFCAWLIVLLFLNGKSRRTIFLIYFGVIFATAVLGLFVFEYATLNFGSAHPDFTLCTRVL